MKKLSVFTADCHRSRSAEWIGGTTRSCERKERCSPLCFPHCHRLLICRWRSPEPIGFRMGILTRICSIKIHIHIRPLQAADIMLLTTSVFFERLELLTSSPKPYETHV